MVLGLLAPVGVSADPAVPDSQGTVKLLQNGVEAQPSNEPQLSCGPFKVEFFFGQVNVSGPFEIKIWAPSPGQGEVVLLGNFLTDSDGYYLSPEYVLPEGHYKVTWGQNKQKVFWVGSCPTATPTATGTQPPPTLTYTPTPTGTQPPPPTATFTPTPTGTQPPPPTFTFTPTPTDVTQKGCVPGPLYSICLPIVIRPAACSSNVHARWPGGDQTWDWDEGGYGDPIHLRYGARGVLPLGQGFEINDTEANLLTLTVGWADLYDVIPEHRAAWEFISRLGAQFLRRFPVELWAGRLYLLTVGYQGNGAYCSKSFIVQYDPDDEPTLLSPMRQINEMPEIWVMTPSGKFDVAPFLTAPVFR